MRSSLQTRRRSLRSVLALLSVSGAAVATVALPPRAAAIGGSVASVSQTTSPRETTGATPSISLFQTSASSYTGGGASTGGGPSAEVTSRGSTSGNRDAGSSSSSEDRPAPSRRRRAASAADSAPREQEESRPESAGRRRTAARREREESRESRTGQSRETVVASRNTGKDAVDRKDKTVVPPPPADRPIFTIGSGWQSRYIYHGLDIISFNSNYEIKNRKFVDNAGNLFVAPVSAQPQSSSIWFTNLGVEYKGFKLKLDYVQAVDSTVPFLQGASGTSSLSGAELSQRRIYRELDPGLSYTLGIANLFDVTLGYTAFLFPNDDFKGTHFNGETLVRIVYKQLKYVRPSFNYFHYNSPFDNANVGDLNGNYVEFRLDGSVPVINQPRFGIGLEPYAAFGYNINYLRHNSATPGLTKFGNQEVGGPNDVELGLRVPVRLGKHFTITPFGNYGIDVSDQTNQKINNFGEGGTDIRVNPTTGLPQIASKGSFFGERTRFWGGVNLSYTF